MPAPEINESCYYVQHDPHKCKIKPEKFPFDILCRFEVIKESLLGGAESAPPQGEIGPFQSQEFGQDGHRHFVGSQPHFHF